MAAPRNPGAAARERLGWWTASRFLAARRAVQLAVLALFASGPLAGVWIAKGTLASSLTLDVLPLTDPLLMVQSFAARHMPEGKALLGAAIVLAFYLVFGGRTFCAWACPVNPVADAAVWLRRRLGLKGGWTIKREARWWMLATVVAVSALTGTLAFELVNPVTAFYRGVLFGAVAGLTTVAAVFLFDLLVAPHGWCGHLCPVGAAYGLLGRATLLRVAARGRVRCDDCLDCFAVCPEPHVIAPALRGEKTGAGPVIVSGDCTACGRCADVCPERVFVFTHRFDGRLDAAPDVGPVETAPVSTRAAA